MSKPEKKRRKDRSSVIDSGENCFWPLNELAGEEKKIRKRRERESSGRQTDRHLDRQAVGERERE
jgi:hypothetical protein